MLYQNALNEFQLIKAQKIYEAGACEVPYWNAKDADCVFAMSNEEAQRVWGILVNKVIENYAMGLTGETCVACILVGYPTICGTCFYANNGHLQCGWDNSTWRNICRNVKELSLILSHEFYRNTIEHLQRKYGI